MKGTLPADLCLVGQLSDVTIDGHVLAVEWKFMSERDIGRKDARTYHLTFKPRTRDFGGSLHRWREVIDVLSSAELAVLRSLLPPNELAKALALSITWPAS